MRRKSSQMERKFMLEIKMKVGKLESCEVKMVSRLLGVCRAVMVLCNLKYNKIKKRNLS